MLFYAAYTEICCICCSMLHVLLHAAYATICCICCYMLRIYCNMQHVLIYVAYAVICCYIQYILIYAASVVLCCICCSLRHLSFARIEFWCVCLVSYQRLLHGCAGSCPRLGAHDTETLGVHCVRFLCHSKPLHHADSTQGSLHARYVHAFRTYVADLRDRHGD